MPDVRGFFFAAAAMETDFSAADLELFLSALALSNRLTDVNDWEFPSVKIPSIITRTFVVAFDEAFFIHDKLSVLLSRATSGEGRSFFELSSALSVYIFK